MTDEAQKLLEEINSLLKVGNKAVNILRSLNSKVDLSEVEENFDNSVIKNLIDSPIASEDKVQILQKLLEKGLSLSVTKDIPVAGGKTYHHNLLDYFMDKLKSANIGRSHAVISEYDYEFIELMLKNTPELQHNYNPENLNALSKAYIWFNDYKMIDLLLQNGANPNSIIHEENQPILKSALEEKNYEIAKLLIEKGADPNLVFDNDAKILNELLRKKNDDIIECLLECKEFKPNDYILPYINYNIKKYLSKVLKEENYKMAAKLLKNTDLILDQWYFLKMELFSNIKENNTQVVDLLINQPYIKRVYDSHSVETLKDALVNALLEGRHEITDLLLESHPNLIMDIYLVDRLLRRNNQYRENISFDLSIGDFIYENVSKGNLDDAKRLLSEIKFISTLDYKFEDSSVKYRSEEVAFEQRGEVRPRKGVLINETTIHDPEFIGILINRGYYFDGKATEVILNESTVEELKAILNNICDEKLKNFFIKDILYNTTYCNVLIDVNKPDINDKFAVLLDNLSPASYKNPDLLRKAFRQYIRKYTGDKVSFVIKDGSPAIVENLLKNGFDPNEGVDWQKAELTPSYSNILTAPLFRVLCNNRKESLQTTKLLLEHKADSTLFGMHLDGDHKQAQHNFLILASSIAVPQIVAFMVDRKTVAGDIFNKKIDLILAQEEKIVNTTVDKYSSLMQLVLNPVGEKYLDRALDLCKRKSYINLQNKEGLSALMCAAKVHDRSMMDKLLKKGANPNLQDKDGNTALTFAIWSENIEAIKLLLNNKADISLKDKQGRTPIDIAFEIGNKDITRFLLRQEELQIKQKKNHLPSLMAAVNMRNRNMVEHLLECGANPNIKDKNGDTLLIMAVKTGNKEIVELVLKQNVDPRIKNKFGNNAEKLATTAEIKNLISDYSKKYKPKSWVQKFTDRISGKNNKQSRSQG
ncbi:MAG: fibronectin type 3 and ankyrin repeat domain 1 protein isoform [Rickettsiaceae bacterium]|jgi:ankyrin repeat protein|nr:fibronectin type 3 and ankyrin repeat domain 1 protein isoform [Rickettsiaceae bacterium]